MLLLLLSLIALLIGPLVYQLAAGRPRFLSLLDGFNLTAVTGLVLLAILPGAVTERNGLVPVIGLVGFLGPRLGERVLRDGHHAMHRMALLLGAVVLALHAGTDGAALVTAGSGGSARLLPFAVLLHQIPVGMSLWWLLRRFGRPVVGGVFGGMILATTLGYLVGDAVVRTMERSELEWFQAFVGGSLLHVIHHRVDPEHHCTEPHRPDRRSETIGAAVALGLLVLLVWWT